MEKCLSEKNKPPSNILWIYALWKIFIKKIIGPDTTFEKSPGMKYKLAQHGEQIPSRMWICDQS